jgi:hypothetical protein
MTGSPADTWYVGANSTNGGNNSGLTFSDCPGVNISGTAYQNIGGSALLSKNITVYKNGSVSLGSAVSNGSTGVWSLSQADISSGDILTIFVDGDEVKGNTILVSDGLEKTNLDVYGGALTVRHDTGASITNANLHTGAIYGESDMVFATSTSNAATLNSGIDLFVWGGDTFAPGGALTLQGKWQSNYRYERHSLCSSFRSYLQLEADFTNNGTFTHNNGTVVFDTM